MQQTCSPAASKLQRLLVLEAEHGPTPGTSPALTDVLNYLENVIMASCCLYIYSHLKNKMKMYSKCLLFQIDRSQNPSDVQMRHTIYSLLAQEGTLESQTVITLQNACMLLEMLIVNNEFMATSS